MKAIVCTKYGPPEVLQLKEVEKPTPKKNEICIKIHATSVTSSDCLVRGFDIPKWHPLGLMMGMVLGFGKPRNPILGMMAAGEVDSVGKDVKRFKIGDQVFAYTVKSPTKIRFGTYAQYICVPEDWLVLPKPSNVTYGDAAAIPYVAAVSALSSLAVETAQRLGMTVIGFCRGKQATVYSNVANILARSEKVL